MRPVRIAFIDWWFGNDSQELARRERSVNPISQGLAKLGVDLKLAFPPRPPVDLAIFGPWGDASAAAPYADAVTIFWTFEHLRSLPQFASYLAYDDLYDFSFTFDPTSERNFNITGAKFAGLLAARCLRSQAQAHAAGKTGFACFLYSNGDEVEDGVQLRNDFFRRLDRLRLVRSGGEVMNNMGGAVPRNQTGAFVARHKFVISMENRIWPRYITEKIMHGYGNGAIPIYCGAPDIDRDFDTRAFVRYTGENFDEVVAQLERLDRDEEAYVEMLTQPRLVTQPSVEYRPGALDARIRVISERLRQRTR